MDGHTIITWNVENWLTVVLMVALFYGLIALVTQGLKRANIFNFGGGSMPPAGS
jgi:hypothetical protein